MSAKKCAFALIGIFASLWFAGCGGSSAPLSIAVTGAPTSGMVDGGDSITLTAAVTNDKNAAGVTWSVSGAGTISGSTTTSTTFKANAATSSSQTATVTATSVADATKTASTTITVPAALTVTNSPTSLNGTVGPYVAQLTGSGGIPPYKNWALAAGSTLPACLTLNSSTGTITFTTNAVAAACAIGSPYDPAFTFQDSGTPTPLTGTTQDFTIVISPATAISLPAALPAVTAGVALTSESVAATAGGAGALTYSVTTGALPGWATLNAATGAITGTPTAAGTTNFTVTAADGYGDSASHAYTLTVNVGAANKLVFTSAPTGNITAGTAFGAVAQVEDVEGNLVTSSNASVTISSTASGVTGTTTVAASGGIATFSGLTLDTSGSYTLTASSGSLIPATSGSFTIVAGTASKLAFTTLPTGNISAGSAFTAVVQVQDTYGNLVNSTATVSISSTAAGVTGTTSVAAVAGVATFSTLTFDTSGTYTLTASSGSLTSATSGNLTVVAGAASKLVFTSSPSGNITAGAAFGATVQIEDANGNLVTTSTASVTISSTAAGISGTTTVAASGGIATFNNLILDAAGSYTITASSGSLTSATSGSFTILAGSASKLVFTSIPTTNVTAGTAFTAVVQVQDSVGNLITSSNASITISSTAAGVSGTTTVSAVAGVATFNSLVLDTSGSYTLTAQSGGLANGTSGSFTVVAAAASKLVFASAPTGNITAAAPFGATVQVQDTYGNVVTTSSASVSLSPSAGSLIGTTTVTAVNGIATFSNLSIDATGTYTLTAASSGLPNVTSGSFTIIPGTATKLVFLGSTPSGNLTAGTTFSVTVQVEDAYGNLETSSGASVTISPSSGSLTGTTTLSAFDGIVTFTNLAIDTSGSYTLTASSGSLTAATSGSFTIVAAAANKLAFTSVPTNVTTGTPFSATVQVQDSFGNLATSSNASVGITSNPSGVSGTTTVSAVNGVASFTNLVLSPSNSYTLTAASSGLSSVTSGSITASSQLIVNTSSLNALDVGQSDSQQLSASGGSGITADYSWSWVAQSGSSLPAGLTLNSNGTFSNSPTTGGVYAVTVTVTDSGTSTSAHANLSLTVYNALSLSPSSLPAGYTNVSYTGGAITGSGGSSSANLSMAISNIQNPVSGLIVPATGTTSITVSGTPTATGTETFTATLTDSATGYSINHGYSVAITTPSAPTLPSNTLPSGTVGTNYNQTISATDNVGSSFTWTINSSTTLNNNQSTSVGNNITVTASGDSLNITGAPSSATSVSFTAQVKDNTDSLSSNTVTYSFTVNPNGSTVSGTLFLYNSCNFTAPTGYFTVTLTNTGTSTVYGTTTTDSGGNYSFNGVPNGTYSITPSLTGSPSGSSSLFYGTDSSLTFSNGIYTGVVLNSTNNNTVAGADFNAEVGYTVSGYVSYSGAQKGWTFLTLSNNSCGGNGAPGTSVDITAPTTGNGALYTIRGVPPGSYTLSAWMDPIGEGVPNAIDPVSSTSNPVTVSVSGTSLSNQDVSIADPTFATPYENPSISAIIPNAEGALILYNPSQQNGNGQEDADGYVVEWSTSPTLAGGTGNGSQQFAAVTGSHTFTASGDNTDLWNLTSAVFQAGLSNGTSSGTFTPGATYYFQFRSYNTLDTANPHPSGWCNYLTGSTNNCGGTSGNFTAVTLTAPSTSGLTQVNGTVTIPAGVTINSGATLYMGLVEFGSSGTNGGPVGIYVNQYTGTLSTGTALPFTVHAPAGSYYGVVAFLDQNNVGLINGPGIVGNANDTITDTITVGTTSPQTLTSLQDVTLAAAGSFATVGTQYYSSTQYCNGCNGTSGPSTSTGYQLDFDVEALDKLPVAVTMVGASNLNVLNNAGTVALDLSGCSQCGQNQFQYQVDLPGGKPNVGDTYTFNVTYSDSTPSTPDTATVTATVTGWNGGNTVVSASDLPTNLSPNYNSSPGATPTFTWTDPAASQGSNFYYGFSISNNSGSNCENGDIWSIPGQNSQESGFSSSITSLTFGTDPNDSNNTPCASLVSGDQYNWQIKVQDSANGGNGNGNQAQASTYFTEQ